MLKSLYAREIDKSYLGKKIKFAGWIHSIRLHGKIAFVILRDKTGSIQATFKKNILGDKFDILKNLREESTILVEGIVQEKVGGGFEILVNNFKVISEAEPLPIEIWNPDINTGFMKRVEYRFLDLRKPEVRAIFVVRHHLIQSLREALISMGFTEMQTPKIVTMGAESGAEVFEIKYYDDVAYLTQSPQLYKQMLMASGIDRYFEFGWYWRAEKSHTSRHTSEFYGLDIEMAWIESHHDVMDVAEEMIKKALKSVKDRAKEELSLLNIDIEVPKEIPRISMLEVYDLLKEHGKELPVGSDLDSESERLLGEIVRKEYDSDFVFVYNYPWEERPFYHMRVEEDPRWTKSFDIIYKGLEIATGAQREHRYEVLLSQAREKGVSLDSLKYYLEAFRYGMPPHGGFGMGVDRFVKQLLNLKDIREAILWFRDPEHVLP